MLNVNAPMRTRLSTTLALGLISIATVACSSESIDQAVQPASNAAAHEEHVDVGILSRGLSANFAMFPTLDAAVADSKYAAVATIDGYQDGQTLVTQYSDGTSDRDHFVVMRVKIRDLLKAPPGEDVSTMYLSHIRGVEAVDADGSTRKGSGEGYTVRAVSEFADAIPVGTQVLVIADPSTPTGAKGETVIAAPGIPDGQTTLDIRHPQRFVVEDTDHSPVSGWQGYKSFDELVADVRKAASE